jgi:hypothetical protein
MTHQIACRCGKLKGYLVINDKENRGICYCTDCQAFAKYLGQESAVLNNAGGTEVVQTLCEFVHFTEGKEALACIKLTERGLLRWYCDCCKTPIANTPDNSNLAFVGLVHNCLETQGQKIEQSFGKIKMVAFTESAIGHQPKPESFGVPLAMVKILTMLLKARIFGGYKKSPFFDIQTGKSVVAPKILSRDELKGLKDKAIN